MSNNLKPLEAQDAVDILCDHFLGKDWYMVDPLGAKQVNAIIVDDIISKYKGVDESPVDKWRRKHKRCEYCRHLRSEGLAMAFCEAKLKIITCPERFRPFCKVFELERR